MANKALNTEIDALIEQKREEIKALEATRRMISPETSTGYEKKPATDVVMSDEGRGDDQISIDWSALGVEPLEDGPTLAERVKGVLKMVPEKQEFTVPHVEALLKQTGFTVAGKSPRARIAMIMAQLEGDGLVIRTAKPKGFKPHRFKLSEKADKSMSLVK